MQANEFGLCCLGSVLHFDSSNLGLIIRRGKPFIVIALWMWASFPFLSSSVEECVNPLFSKVVTTDDLCALR